MQDQFNKLKDELQRNFPQSYPKLTLFPSGAAMLDVKIGNETYVLEYHINVGLGINRISKATFGWEGYEHTFENMEDVKAFLLPLLQKSE